MQSLSAAALIALIGATALAGNCHAQANFYSTGTLYNASDLPNAAATGQSMSGMRVSWRFTDNSQFQAAWGALGGGHCGVDNGGFRLSLNCAGDSLNDWTLENLSGKALNVVTLQGAPGATVFDCSWAGTACAQNGNTGLVGTPNSSIGLSFERTGGTYVLAGVGSYSNLVGVAGAAPVGDLFEQFSMGFVGMASGHTYTFQLDTDISSLDLAPVPEPGTVALMLAGLAGLMLKRRWAVDA